MAAAPVGHQHRLAAVPEAAARRALEPPLQLLPPSGVSSIRIIVPHQLRQNDPPSCRSVGRGVNYNALTAMPLPGERAIIQAAISNGLVNSLKPQAKPFEVRDTRLKGLLLRVQPDGVMSYVVEYGRGKRLTVGRADALAPAQARNRARAILADAYAGNHPMAARRRARAHTLASFVDEVYKPWAETNIRTTKGALYRLRANFPDLQDKKLGEINAWVVEKWRAARLKAGAKPATVNRGLDDLRAALAKAVAWGLLGAHPLTDVKRSRTDTKAVVRFLDGDERARLMAALDAREERIRRERGDQANAWRAERGYPLLPDLRAVAFADHLRPLVLCPSTPAPDAASCSTSPGVMWTASAPILRSAARKPSRSVPGTSRSTPRLWRRWRRGANRRPPTTAAPWSSRARAGGR